MIFRSRVLCAIIATTTLMIFSTPADARSPNSVCITMGEMAKSIMDGRQVALTRSDILSTPALQNSPPSVRAIMQSLVRTFVTEAFKIERYTDPADQQIAAEEFRVRAESACTESGLGD